MKSLILFLIFNSLSIHAEITPPNYDFTFKSLENFLPGKSIEELKKEKINYDIFEDNGSQKVIRAKLIRANYSLDLYLQVKNDNITDLFVRLPQHFLHDIFLKDLQTKWKKQDRYVRHDKSALYVWLNRDNNNILYHGSCSITCFPMFIEIVSNAQGITPLYKKFNEALPRW